MPAAAATVAVAVVSVSIGDSRANAAAARASGESGDDDEVEEEKEDAEESGRRVAWIMRPRKLDDRRRATTVLLPVLRLIVVWLAVTGLAHAAPMDEEDEEMLPSFEPTASNVTAFEGQTVYLPCRVRNLGDKVVSWMRSRDLHILTSDKFTFSSDERFKPQHLSGSDAWTLQLDRVRKSDAGRYECQVNTEPKIMYAVQLVVRDPNKPDGYDEPHSQQTRISYESTAPVAAIMGPREQRVSLGVTITLKCVITSPYQTKPIKGVQWFKDNKLLTFQAARGGINVETVTGTAQTLSEATLANVTRRDNGKYSCRPVEGKADTILLSVDDDGEHSEAMQRDAAYTSSGVGPSCRKSSSSTWLVAVVLTCLILLHNYPMASVFR